MKQSCEMRVAMGAALEPGGQRRLTRAYEEAEERMVA